MTESKNTGTATSSQRKALIVEDDPYIGRLLTFLLEKEGFAPVLASDGRAGEDAIASDTPFAILLLDVMLPLVNGYELLQQARRMPAREGVPIIMLTAKSQEGDIVRALDLGANDHLVKPFQPNELKARIRRLVK